MKRFVYIASGSPAGTAADMARLPSQNYGVPCRVVAPASVAASIMDALNLSPGEMISCSSSSFAAVWFRLSMFLRFSLQSHVICCKSSGGPRWLKLLALLLPGKLYFVESNQPPQHCSRLQLVRAAIAGQGPWCVFASASTARLQQIVTNFRERYPHARLHGVLRSPADPVIASFFDTWQEVRGTRVAAIAALLPRCLGKRRFQGIVLPCTAEGGAALKWIAWLLPIWRIEAYNEQLDVFFGRNPLLMLKHAVWRMRQRRDRVRYETAWHHFSLPVVIIGSASGYYLKKIIPAVRAAFPGVQLHGIIPRSLERPTEGLFEARTILEPGIFGALRQCWRLSRRQFQACIIPCTTEPYLRMHLLGWLPLFGPRYIYNEFGDGFPVRNTRMLLRHFTWRLRELLSFQIASSAAGRTAAVRLMHLSVYPLRLMLGLGVLLRVRLASRVRRLQQTGEHARPIRRAVVDMIYLGGEATPPPFELPRTRGNIVVRVAARVTSRYGTDRVRQMNAAIAASDADFVCLMDSCSRAASDYWLDALLQCFDEATAQVGPQIVNAVDGSVVRGGIIGRELKSQWNSDHAVCWDRRPEWLGVDLLPWVCVVVRRSVFLEAGYFSRECGSDASMPVDADFCRRLASNGWRSICNQNVTVFYPAGSANKSELQPTVRIAETFETPEVGS
ncbi:MAG: hypothetical protein HYX72_09200 [Acidobacteria bacterium]|nr:hypothetical protein [Acidobacteriota bacterium]